MYSSCFVYHAYVSCTQLTQSQHYARSRVRAQDIVRDGGNSRSDTTTGLCPLALCSTCCMASRRRIPPSQRSRSMTLRRSNSATSGCGSTRKRPASTASATLATGVFLTYLIPDTLLFIPLFKMFAWVREYTGIELINHWWTMIILYPTLTVPFATWIMIGYFASIPKELDEAALIDGASWTQTLTKIFIPVALPGIIAATIFSFTVSWAQFLYPLAFTTSTDQLVLPVGIVTTLIKGDVFNWGQIMTGALLGAAPPLIIYAFLMDYYIAGLTGKADAGTGGCRSRYCSRR